MMRCATGGAVRRSYEILALALWAASALAQPGSAAAVSSEARTFVITGAAPMEAISVGILTPTGPKQTKFKGTAQLQLSNASTLALTVRLGVKLKLDRATYTFRSAAKGFPRFKGVVRTTGEADAVTSVRLVLTRGRRDKVTQRDARSMSVAPAVTTTTRLATTTTTSAAGSTTTTTLAPACLSDGGDGTVVDTCAGLQWEKKDGPVTGAPDPENLHDVDNRYLWAGRCTIGAAPCQPNATAAATCRAQDGGPGCVMCGAGEGTCDVDPRRRGAITTIWDWINQVNAEGFAGYGDWRLPSEAGQNTCRGCDPRELETILDVTQPFCGLVAACIDPIFGSTAAAGHWSATSSASDPDNAWCVGFHDGFTVTVPTDVDLRIRAVRDGP